MAASLLSASAVVIITWQVGAQAHTGSAGTSAVTMTGTSGSTGASDSGSASSPTDTSAGTSTGDATSASTAAPASGASGSFTGSLEQTRFGTVQVQITVANGSITDVIALKLTDDGGRSVQISNQAAPILREEVLSAQSASVQMVSGATYTSDAYLASLQSAIDQAGL